MNNLLRNAWGGLLLAALLAVVFLLPGFSISSTRPVETDFLRQTSADKALVFFGFTGCGDVCPASMTILRQVLNHWQVAESRPAVFFIDIDQRSSAQRAQAYASQFHQDFIGVHANEPILRSLSADFNLNIQQRDDQILHRGRTYLLQKKQQQWYLTKTYNPTTFDHQTLIQELFE
ncbi:SCO family protein [Lacimicrobium sp. SS2-24]|uniref:SCO family protein n=1 Tax=Lacimicrobium sp. SS2-24 TaxID=2005569 RepID=UPI000B4A6404|nr:SCO family protein [Lacimicrobium sp. SS2-24]